MIAVSDAVFELEPTQGREAGQQAGDVFGVARRVNAVVAILLAVVLLVFFAQLLLLVVDVFDAGVGGVVIKVMIAVLVVVAVVIHEPAPHTERVWTRSAKTKGVAAIRSDRCSMGPTTCHFCLGQTHTSGRA